MNEKKWDYIFLFSSLPTPRMLDKVRLAIELGYCVACCYLKRPNKRYHVEAIDGCDIIEKPVHFSGVHNGFSFRRLLSIPDLMIWLRRSIFKRAAKSCYIHTDSLDLLLLAELAAAGNNSKFHHQVRDLHPLQLSTGIRGFIMRAIDRIAMKRVSMLMLTCEGYYDNYYKDIYFGEYVVVENWPDHTVWKNFKRNSTDVFTIGYVGVVRYVECFRALIQAIDSLHEQGIHIRLKIAGGGEELNSLSKLITERRWIEQTGAFDYSREITTIYADVDLIWSVYDASLQNVRIAMPNKFYEAILGKIPIVVADGTYLASRVRRDGIGTSVPCNDPESIAKILGIAAKKEGWYASAEQILANQNPSTYLEREHPLLLRQAVTGTTDE